MAQTKAELVEELETLTTKADLIETRRYDAVEESPLESHELRSA
jgi:hypothetical protein